MKHFMALFASLVQKTPQRQQPQDRKNQQRQQKGKSIEGEAGIWHFAPTYILNNFKVFPSFYAY